MFDNSKSSEFINPVWTGFFIIICLAARLIWPADVPFINDEPFFLDFGFQFSKTFDPLILGLQGKVGVKYGPYTSWFFGCLLLISKNLITLAFFKILIVSMMTLISLIWLKNNLEFVKWHSLLPIMASLFLFMDARLIWDLNIPNTLLAFAAYVAFIRHEQFKFLLLSIVMLGFATLTHLMCLPLVFAIVIHFFVYKWSWIKSNLGKMIVLIVVLAAICGPYYHYVLSTPRSSHLIPFELDSVWYALLGGRLFSTHHFDYFLGNDWLKFSSMPDMFNIFCSGLSYFTLIAYPLSWFGLFHAGKLIWQSKLRLSQIDIETQVLAMAIVTVFFHTLFSVVTDLRDHPHYYNGVWPGILMLFWYGIESLSKSKLFKFNYLCYSFILLFFLWKIVIDLHLNHGTRTLHYGPTLGNQIEVVKEIRKIENLDAIKVVAAHPRAVPQAFMFIFKVMGKLEDGHKIRINNARVDYVSRNPNDGQIHLLIEN